MPITFDRTDHPDYLPRPGKYPLVLAPTINKVRLNRVLIDGGSYLDIMFASTLKALWISIAKLQTSRAPFHGVIPSTQHLPLGQIALPVTFGTRENYRTERLTFEAADFETGYHAIFGRPTLTKFMAIPHYIYMMLKMPVPKVSSPLRQTSRRHLPAIH